MRDNKFEKLLEPGYIGKVKTRNRIIKPGASMGLFSAGKPHLSEEAKYFHETLARGGVGLLIVESPNFDYPYGARNDERAFLENEEDAEELSELCEITHKHNCPTFLQLYHSGIWQLYPTAWSPAKDKTKCFYDGSPIGASSVSFKSMLDIHNQEPRALTIPEIKKMVDTWARTTVLAHKAGFDGVDLNAGSSHLLHSFLSPFFNRREDEYGGSVENRSRIVVEIIQEIKKRLGNDFPVIVTMNGFASGYLIGVDDQDAQPFQDTVQTARLFEAAGADALQVRSHFMGRHRSSYMLEQLFYPEAPLPLKEIPKEYDVKRRGFGSNLKLAQLMKAELSIPILGVGRIDAPVAEQFLKKGQVDFIAMNRALVADPDLPNKLRDGRFEDVRPCTSCCTCSNTAGLAHDGTKQRSRCMVNAAFGQGYDYDIVPAEKVKNVVVIGGGPSGMEAARVAALRGHKVTLYEKSGRLGGLVPVAAVVKGLEIERFLELARHLEKEVQRLRVNIVLKQEMNAARIEGLKADAVVLALGSQHGAFEIPGMTHSKVISTDKLHSMLESFMKFLKPELLAWGSKLTVPIGKKVVVIGGGFQGCEIAEFLTKRGREVTVVEQGEELGEEMIIFRKLQLVEWLKEKGANLLTGVQKYVEITDDGLTIINKDGNKQVLEADNFIPAFPQAVNDGLLKDLAKRVKEVYAVGSCIHPGLVPDAIGSASAVARLI